MAREFNGSRAKGSGAGKYECEYERAAGHGTPEIAGAPAEIRVRSAFLASQNLF